ncbi:MAG: hypothetical protein Q9224_005829 [Gallowayella concinna]
MNRDWLTEERTIFKGVRKVRPGHYMICLGFDQFKERQYWDHTYPDKNRVEPRSVQEMVEGVRSKLLEAVRVRLQADVPVGIHLSGGIDSSVIAGMAKHLLDTNQIQLGGQGTIQKLQCLGVAFDKGSGFDESDLAQRTSDWLGVDFQMVEMNESKLAANFEDAVWYDEQTHIDLAFVGKHMLSKLTRGMKTIFLTLRPTLLVKSAFFFAKVKVLYDMIGILLRNLVFTLVKRLFRCWSGIYFVVVFQTPSNVALSLDQDLRKSN